MSYSPRYERFAGHKHMVVPVVMVRAGLARKGVRINREQLVPDAWNGVLVTADHGGECIGYVFNARRDGDFLKGEAWLQLKPLMRVQSLYDRLKTGERVGASVSYAAAGHLHEDVADAADLLPNHLALLTQGEGAFSFEDGCGVRAD